MVLVFMQLTRDLFAIAKFLFVIASYQTHTGEHGLPAGVVDDGDVRVRRVDEQVLVQVAVERELVEQRQDGVDATTQSHHTHDVRMRQL